MRARNGFQPGGRRPVNSSSVGASVARTPTRTPKLSNAKPAAHTRRSILRIQAVVFLIRGRVASDIQNLLVRRALRLARPSLLSHVLVGEAVAQAVRFV